ncbi:MAG TPA: hypothetical protein VID72_08585 [Ktedonobacterales bacterium]|jgi:hypothetical protein
MHYQVVAKSSGASAGWEYYPYWSPLREKESAERLASYAAQCGYEAAIIQSVTPEMLLRLAHGVVERQDTRLLPALRYLPGSRVATTTSHREYHVETAFRPLEGLNPYVDGSDKSEWDARRLKLEMGPGGDVVARDDWRPQPISLPMRMGVLHAWLSLRQRLLQEQVGGPLDGVSGS